MIYYSTSECGLVRKNNEDSIACEKIGNNLCVVLADGLGGCSNSEEASKIATTRMLSILKDNSELVEKFSDKELEEVLNSSFQKINNEIAIKASSDKTDMATTLSVAIVSDKKVLIAHVGDCRTYLLHGSKLEQLTKDHTYANKLLDEGKITEDTIDSNPGRNVLTKYLGENCFLTPDIYRYNIMYGDLILLCSDGLYTNISEIDLRETLRKHANLEQCASDLLNAVYTNGASDNVSLVLVHNKPVK
ncbi:MAG: protein phosphatase 2C domain-containing protein [Clostridia bacterium]|nr:protein phosphatase 2C domain-containing protein [Clostridia bacterium]